MMEPDQIRNVIEACLLVAGRPMSVAQLESLFGEDEDRPDRAAIREALAALAGGYEGRGIELVEVAGGWRLQTRATMEHWVARLFDERPPRYSRALLETLVLIAYRQPITRGEIEEVRGVAVSSNIVRTLQDRRWVREVGHKDVPGKPALLGTTSEFLDYFNLRRLDDLPALGEISDLDGIEAVLAAELGLVDEGGKAANDGDGPPETETETGEGIDGDATAGTDELRGDGSSDIVEPMSDEGGRETPDVNGDEMEADTSSTDEADRVEVDVRGESPNVTEAGTVEVVGENVGAGEEIERDDQAVRLVSEREDERPVEPVDEAATGGGDASAAARPRADGPTAERMRDASVSAPEGSVAEVLEAEPPVVAIVRPADADGAEARLFRAIGEFAGEHRAEIEARDAFERRSATTRAVHDVAARAANDGDRSTERAGDPEDERAGGREGEGEDTLGGHPGGRPRVSTFPEGAAPDAPSAPIDAASDADAASGVGTPRAEDADEGEGGDGARNADPPDPSDIDP